MPLRTVEKGDISLLIVEGFCWRWLSLWLSSSLRKEEKTLCLVGGLSGEAVRLSGGKAVRHPGGFQDYTDITAYRCRKY